MKSPRDFQNHYRLVKTKLHLHKFADFGGWGAGGAGEDAGFELGGVEGLSGLVAVDESDEGVGEDAEVTVAAMPARELALH